MISIIENDSSFKNDQLLNNHNKWEMNRIENLKYFFHIFFYY